MNSKPKILAQLQLTNADAAIYTVPALTQAKISAIVFFNNASGSDKTVHLQCKKSGGFTRKLDQKVIADNVRFADVTEYLLGAGDEIRAHASAATTVDCTVFGVEYPET